MKRRNKILSFVLCLVTMSCFMGCAKVCNSCGEKKKCTTTEILGQKINICQDCANDFSNEMESLSDDIDSFLDELNSFSY